MPSRIPDVLTYLVAQCTALQSTTLAGVRVQDGPPTLALTDERKVLVIGGEWEPSDTTRPGAAAEQTPSMGNASRDEAISVTCSAFSQSGDADVAGRRTEAFGITSAVEAMIVADRTLGGLCYGDARLDSVDEYRAVQNERGSAAVVDFTITATALLWDG